MQARVFCFSLVAAAFWIPTACVAGEGRSNLVHMHDFKSHFQWDFLAYCTRPVSVHLATASVGCSFNSFSIFLLSLKQQQNLVKIMFSCIHFPICPYPPQNNDKLYFILVNCMGWQVCIQDAFIPASDHSQLTMAMTSFDTSMTVNAVENSHPSTCFNPNNESKPKQSLFHTAK